MSVNVHRMLTVWWAHWPIVAAGATRSAAIVLKANRVVACSSAAAADGVAIGQRRRVAQQRCPGAVLLDDDPDRDAEPFTQPGPQGGGAAVWVGRQQRQLT